MTQEDAEARIAQLEAGLRNAAARFHDLVQLIDAAHTQEALRAARAGHRAAHNVVRKTTGGIP